MAEGVNMAVVIGITIDRIVAKLGALSVFIVVCTNFFVLLRMLYETGNH
jgi:hypothetical protein